MSTASPRISPTTAPSAPGKASSDSGTPMKNQRPGGGPSSPRSDATTQSAHTRPSSSPRPRASSADRPSANTLVATTRPSRTTAMPVRSAPSRTMPPSERPDPARRRPSTYAPDTTVPRWRAASSVAVAAPLTTSEPRVTSVHTSTMRPRCPTSERRPRPSSASAATSSWSCVVATPRRPASSSVAAAARTVAFAAASRIARVSSEAAIAERRSSRSNAVTVWKVRMSSLSTATATRSARCRCSATANASRTASAADARSVTRPPARAPSASVLSQRPTMRKRDSSRRPMTTRTMPDESSTPATTGPRDVGGRTSRAWGAGLVAVTSSVQTLADRGACRFDRLRQATRVLSAGRGALRASPALSIDDPLHLFHQRVGVEHRDQVFRDRDDEKGIAFPHTAQDDDPRPDPGLHLVGESAQLLYVALADVRGDELCGPDRLGLGQQPGGGGLDAAALLRLELTLQPLARLHELRERLGYARR